MSQADELEKLSQLKEKGVLTDAEFNAKKAEILSPSSTNVKKSYRLLWAIPVIILGAMGILDAASDLGGLSGGHSKFQCDGTVAKDTLQKAFDQSQFARNMNLSAIQISDVSEQSRDPKSGELSCQAIIMLNTTNKVPVSYKMENGQKGQFLLTFEVLDEARISRTTSKTPNTLNSIQPGQMQAQIVEKCVEKSIENFKKDQDEDVLVGVDMLEEWTDACKTQLSK
jgi:hypothetical protein